MPKWAGQRCNAYLPVFLVLLVRHVYSSKYSLIADLVHPVEPSPQRRDCGYPAFTESVRSKRPPFATTSATMMGSHGFPCNRNTFDSKIISPVSRCPYAGQPLRCPPGDPGLEHLVGEWGSLSATASRLLRPSGNHPALTSRMVLPQGQVSKACVAPPHTRASASGRRSPNRQGSRVLRSIVPPLDLDSCMQGLPNPRQLKTCSNISLNKPYDGNFKPQSYQKHLNLPDNFRPSVPAIPSDRCREAVSAPIFMARAEEAYRLRKDRKHRRVS
jgi:hypothetical protein